jgi:hypothetical protein
LLPWAALMIVVGLTGGWLTARTCSRSVGVAAAREAEETVDDITRRLAAVAGDLVLAPADSELDQLDRFRAELRIAAGEGLANSAYGWPAGD